MSTDFVSFTETIDGREVEMILVETWDGLYTPIGVVRPEGDGPFPIVLLASGNGGEGLGWLRDAADANGLLVVTEALSEASVDRVKQLGGQVLNGPMEVPGGDRIAQCMDPQGAVFALHSSAG